VSLDCRGFFPPLFFVLLLKVDALVGYGIAAEIVSRRNLT